MPKSAQIRKKLVNENGQFKQNTDGKTSCLDRNETFSLRSEVRKHHKNVHMNADKLKSPEFPDNPVVDILQKECL